MDVYSLILTIISICIAFVSLLISTFFSIRKDRSAMNERENENIRFMQRIEDKLDSTNIGINQLTDKVKSLDKNVCDLKNDLVEQKQRITHLEKEVFK